MSQATIGIIGGTGLYGLDGLGEVEKRVVHTPFGAPSSPLLFATLAGVKIVFLARHGMEHDIPPSQINYRANIYALKSEGVIWCLGVSAVGSLSEGIQPGEMIIPDQIIDLTKRRESSFFDDGLCAHVSLADPFCPVLSKALYESAAKKMARNGAKAHFGGTYVCIEGPTFSTRAESQLYRLWGGKVIGMTNMPEARLAREAEMSYSTLGLVTDYDCWRSADAQVDVSDIFDVLGKNLVVARQIVAEVVPGLGNLVQPEFVSEALKHAIVTSPLAINSDALENLGPIIKRYIS